MATRFADFYRYPHDLRVSPPWVMWIIQLVRGPLVITNLIMKAIGGLLTTLLVALSCVYVLARLALLVKGLVLLRTAFLAVDWTKYLPSLNV